MAGGDPDEYGYVVSGTDEQVPDVSAEEYREAFGEDITRTLDLETWKTGEDLSEVYARLEAEVREAVEQENRTREEIRRLVFPQLKERPGAPKHAGAPYACKRADLEKIQRGLLFNGGVEACDGTRQVHDTLPLTIYQIGVSLVSYRGDQGTWVHRLFRRDLRANPGGGNPANEALELLQRRSQRAGQNQESPRDKISNLAGRAVMSYAERAILLRRSQAVWRMGHGNPAPYELITGSGTMDMMVESTKVIRELVEHHQKFVYVASEPSDRLLLTIGQALYPLEYAIVGSLQEAISKIVENGHYRMKVNVDMTWDGSKIDSPEAWIRLFRDFVAPQVVVGVYRATPAAPAQVFYAHAEHVHVAAHIAIADSILQYHRGFPMLIDLADHVCSHVFGRETLYGPVSTAYTEAGAPWQYLSERATRK
jgi:hypothetical protein